MPIEFAGVPVQHPSLNELGLEERLLNWPEPSSLALLAAAAP